MPILGKNVIGPNTTYSLLDTMSYGWAATSASSFYLSVKAKILNVYAYVQTQSGTGLIRLGAYNGQDATATLAGQTPQVAFDTTWAWRGADLISPPIMDVGYKTLAVKFSVHANVRYGSEVGSVRNVNASRTFDDMPDPLGTPGGTQSSDAYLSIYATYEEVALGGDEGLGARAVLPILARRREPLSFPPRLGWLARFPKLKPLRI